jgi:predicted transglutaminase-like protease
VDLKKYFMIGLVVVLAYQFSFHYGNNTSQSSGNLDWLGKNTLSKLNENEIINNQALAYSLKGNNSYDTIWNIIFWEEDNIRYDWDKYYSKSFNIQSPTETINSGSGVCIDYAILTSCFLAGLGYDSYIFVIDSKNPYSGGHAFCAVKINGKYYALDQHAPISDVDSHITNCIKEYPDLNPQSVRYYHFYPAKLYDVKGNVEKWSYNPNNKKLTSQEKKEIENSIIQYFSNKYHLKPDFNINNMENMKYLPRGYSYGMYVYQGYNCTLHPEFGKYYGKWLDRRFSGHLSLTEKNEGKSYKPIEFDKYSRIWVKVEDNGGCGKIYLYLAR